MYLNEDYADTDHESIVDWLSYMLVEQEKTFEARLTTYEETLEEFQEALLESQSQLRNLRNDSWAGPYVIKGLKNLLRTGV